MEETSLTQMIPCEKRNQKRVSWSTENKGLSGLRFPMMMENGRDPSDTNDPLLEEESHEVH